MAKSIKEQSTQELKRKMKIGRIILIVCWSMVIISVIITLSLGISPFRPASSTGFIALGLATIAMLSGAKKIREELARRDS